MRTGVILKCTNQDFSFFVTYKKIISDQELLNAKKATLLVSYPSTRNRPSPNVTSYASDNDNEVEGVYIDVMNDVRTPKTHIQRLGILL